MAQPVLSLSSWNARGLTPLAGINMDGVRLLDRRWVRVASIIGLWTLFGLFLVSQTGLAFSRRDWPVNWYRIFSAELAFGYAWAALTPLVLWLARRFPLERERWVGSLAGHVFASLLIGLATRAFRDFMFFYLVAEPDSQMTFAKLFLNVYLF